MALLNKLKFFPLNNANTNSTTTTTIDNSNNNNNNNNNNDDNDNSRSGASAISTTTTRGVAAAAVAQATTTSSTMASPAAAAAVFANAKNCKPTFKSQINSTNYLSKFPFHAQQVRVLFYREEDHHGRRLIFDSNALEKVYLRDGGNPDGFVTANAQKRQTANNKMNTANFIEVCPEYGYKHNRPSSTDITSIGEMIFGSLAMSFRGTAFKVHWLTEPARMLCSQVFLAPLSGGGANRSTYSMQNLLASPRTSICSDQGSVDTLSMNSVSMPFTIRVGQQSLSAMQTERERDNETRPLDVPEQKLVPDVTHSAESTPRLSSTYSNTTDSGYSGISRVTGASGRWSQVFSTRNSIGSVISDQSVESRRKLSTDSAIFSCSPLLKEFANDGYMRRRISRNLCTSLEYEQSMNDIVGFPNDPCLDDAAASRSAMSNHGGSEGNTLRLAPNFRRASYCANESRSNPEIGTRRDANSSLSKSHTRRAKLGLAVCMVLSESFEEEMELFCSEHIPLLEAMLCRLRARAEHAYINHHNFLQIMFEAWQQAQQWLLDLFTAPRIKAPIWLGITTSGSKHSKSIADRFVKELCWLLSFADTKDTNFFISTMLTAVLTYHLGWLATVAAFNQALKAGSSPSIAAIEQRAKLLRVSQMHPYNALWAQLGDLYGAIGIPPKLVRTIVHGTEKLSVEKLLNVLSYFIRCGEVRRTAKREDFNKDAIDALVFENNNNNIINNNNNNDDNLSRFEKLNAYNKSMPVNGMDSNIENDYVDGCNITGLRRCQTFTQNLSEVKSISSNLHSTLKRNEIPNVLAFRDSHFVQQELRIGNYHMDTGIEKSGVLTTKKDTSIRLTITTPDNIELNANEVRIDDAVEAIEDVHDCASASNDNINNQDQIEPEGKTNFLWNMVPAKVKEGLSINEVAKLQEGVKLINRKLGARSTSLLNENKAENANKNPTHTLMRHSLNLSLSDLITQNSMGKNERMTWGIEPIKENVCLEEQIHFENSQKMAGREHFYANKLRVENNKQKNDKNGNVMFVLGDNDLLVNLKKANEDTQIANNQNNEHNEGGALCAMHQRSDHDTTATTATATTTTTPTHAKKRSGVKFNFEQYPQIATNYMKSKNLVLTNYEMLIDKMSSKFEANTDMFKALDNLEKLEQQPELNLQTYANNTSESSSSCCVMCNSPSPDYQTPSNATELEFETDDMHCHTRLIGSSLSNAKHTMGSETSINTIKCSPQATEIQQMKTLKARVTTTTDCIDSNPVTCDNGHNYLKLPMPGIKDLPLETEPACEKLRTGFIPSLLLGICDHYVPDMILQGTTAAPSQWEAQLLEDLTLATHSASLIAQTSENLAIIADMEKWEVRILATQTQHFQYGCEPSAPVGMSQLVSTMLETVQAMNAGGMTAYDCLSYIEAKLQEIYLHSEALAAFLLETDFCPLSAITTALDLSENDVPLLLAIATVHTPKIARKCGISFR